jgi:hypothetical protein
MRFAIARSRLVESPATAPLRAGPLHTHLPGWTAQVAKSFATATESFHLVGLPDDFIATFISGPSNKRRLLLQQSNALPPLLLEQRPD